jgi:DnaJ domain
MADDYYTLLKVSRGASAEEIQDALRQQLMTWSRRASNAPKAADRHEAEQQVELLGQVKAVLTDPARRAQYDHTLAGDQPKQVPEPIPHRIIPDPGPGPNYQSNPQTDQRWDPQLGYQQVTQPRWIKRRHPVWTVILALIALDGFVSAAGVYGPHKSGNPAENAVLGVIALLIAVYFSGVFRRL